MERGQLTSKPSNIPWLGQVPEHWEVKRLKYLLARNDGGVWGEEDDPEGTIVLRSTDQTVDGEWNVVDPARRALSTREAADGRLEIGDLVVTKSSGSQLHIGKTCIVTAELAYSSPCFSNFMQRLRTKDELVPRLAWYVLNSELGRQQLVFNSNTTTGLANLNGTVLGEILLPLPPLPEQRAIATYLDERTARIDGLVARKRRLVHLLKEKRQALITRAVTRGLDPKARMKDSGVPWLGDVPEGWEVKPLRYLGTFQNGISAGAEYFGSGEPFVNYKDVYGNPELPVNVEGLANSTFEDQYRYSVRRGDVLFTRTSETIEEIGISSTCLHTIERATFSGFVIRFRPLPGFLSPDFAKHYFRSDVHRSFFVKEMNLVTRASLGQELLKKLPVLLPPLHEQQAVADWIDMSCSRLDSLVTKVEVAIARLQEYRTALISAAVTGKVRVPQ